MKNWQLDKRRAGNKNVLAYYNKINREERTAKLVEQFNEEATPVLKKVRNKSKNDFTGTICNSQLKRKE